MSSAGRWRSLDALRGAALFLMLAHHIAGWTGGDVRHRFIGFDAFIVTDLAAPMFAVGVGAAAYLVGQRLTGAAGWTKALRRWLEVLAVGVALDIATDGHLDGGGVLPTLAVLGLVTTVAVGLGLRSPWAWWAAAAGGAAAAVPATTHATHGLVPQLWTGRFAVPVYLVFAAGGAAVVAHGAARDRRAGPAGGEGSLPLVPAAGITLLVAAGLSALAPTQVAPHGLWPPARYPGDLAFTAWGLAATLVAWAAIRTTLRFAPVLGPPLARAGQRTLLVFSLQLGLRVVLKRLGLLGQLDTWSWGLVTWAGITLICIGSCLPRPHRRRPEAVGSDGPSRPAVLVGR